MYKQFFSTLLSATLLSSATAGVAAEQGMTGAVNFSSCMTDSKQGKKEQESFEALRKQMSSLVESTEKEFRDLAAKLEDTDYLEGLSPKAEEEARAKCQALQEDLNRYHNQFYQVLQHANYQMMQNVSSTIGKAAQSVAEKNGLAFVANKEAFFYIRPDLDVTAQVIVEMDKQFELDSKAKTVSENGEVNSAIEELSDARAG